MAGLNLQHESDAGPTRAETDMPRCPQCGWHDVRRSVSKRPLDFAFTAFSMAPFRCRTCGHRFFRFFRRSDNR
jgi:DNA-directed RNA polymerase subunit RPC12/RpoP